VPAYLCRFAVRAHRTLTSQLFLAAWAEPLRGALTPRSHSRLGVTRHRVYQAPPPTCLARHNQSPVGLPFCVPTTLITIPVRGRNVDRLSIGYAFRPRLRSRLTLSGRTFLKKPEAYGGQDSHLPFRYSCRHSHFRLVQQSSRSAFALLRNAPLPPTSGRYPRRTRGFGDWLEPRCVLGAASLDQ
jgi:hypothetical protein